LEHLIRSKEVLALNPQLFQLRLCRLIFLQLFFIYLAKVRGLDLKVSAFYTTLPFLAMAACQPAGRGDQRQARKLYGKRAGRCGIGVFGPLDSCLSGKLARKCKAPAGQCRSCWRRGRPVSFAKLFSVSTADIAAGSSGSVSGS